MIHLAPKKTLTFYRIDFVAPPFAGRSCLGPCFDHPLPALSALILTLHDRGRVCGRRSVPGGAARAIRYGVVGDGRAAARGHRGGPKGEKRWPALESSRAVLAVV